MSWEIWGAAIISSIAASGVGGLLTKAVVENSLKHGFDRKLEALRSDLRLKESEISDLKAGALSLSSARYAELDKRCVEAAANLWAATTREMSHRFTIAIVARLNLPAIAKYVNDTGEGGQKMQQFGEAMSKMSGLQNRPADPQQSPDKDRLFLPQEAWTAYDALRSISGAAIAILSTLQAGAPLSILNDPSEVNEKVLLALPQQKEFLAKFPESGAYYLIHQLEAKILSDLGEFLYAHDSHFKAVNSAKLIIAHAKEAGSGQLPPNFPEQFKTDPPPLSDLT